MSTAPIVSGAAVAIGGPTFTWAVPPADHDRFARWLHCQADWLTAIERRSGAANTRRAYEADLADFIAFHAAAGRPLLPWQVTPADAEAWVQHLRSRGLSPATINRRIAALASLYHYAATEAVHLAPDGTRTPLWRDPNPFASRTLRTRNARGRAAYPSATQVTALLAQINPHTSTGLRNLAILAGLFATTRRVSEWLNLHSADLHDGDAGIWFEYRYKGGDRRRQLIPADIWRLIQAYLRATGRLGPDGRPLPNQYIFTATTDAGRRLRGPGNAGELRPLSASYVAQLIRRYGRAAGIPAELLHAHALRHAGARWRKEHGADVWQLKETLGHKSLTTTQIYTETVLTQPEDPLADTIGAILPRQVKGLFR